MGILDTLSNCTSYNTTMVAAEIAALQKLLPAGTVIILVCACAFVSVHVWLGKERGPPELLILLTVVWQ